MHVLMLRHKHTPTRTHTQAVTRHLNNIFHSCCGSQWLPMWLLCVDMCEKCGDGNRHGYTRTQEHLHTQHIFLCAVMSPCRKSPLHPVMLWYPMSVIKCPLTWNMRRERHVCMRMCGLRCMRFPRVGDVWAKCSLISPYSLHTPDHADTPAKATVVTQI